jgi:hypothetical protein
VALKGNPARSPAELLEEKDVITQAEWEQRIKKNLKP